MQQAFPGLHFEGGNYPTAPWRQAVASVLSWSTMGGLAYLFVGPQLLASAGMEEPPVIAQLRDNKMALVMGYFVANQVSQQLVATGAFEVAYNGEPVWSKLATGRPPSPAELYALLLERGLQPDVEAAARLGLLGRRGRDREEWQE